MDVAKFKGKGYGSPRTGERSNQENPSPPRKGEFSGINLEKGKNQVTFGRPFA